MILTSTLLDINVYIKRKRRKKDDKERVKITLFYYVKGKLDLL